MSKKHTSKYTHQIDIPYDANDANAIQSFWDKAIPHQGVEELRAKKLASRLTDKYEDKEQITLQIDADVLAWYRSLGIGWQTKMNAVLKEYRDAQAQ